MKKRLKTKIIKLRIYVLLPRMYIINLGKLLIQRTTQLAMGYRRIHGPLPK